MWKLKNHSVRVHRMNKVSIPLPCFTTEELNENLSNANVTLFPSLYILNQVLRKYKVFLFSKSTFKRHYKALLKYLMKSKVYILHIKHPWNPGHFYNDNHPGQSCWCYCHWPSRCLQIQTCNMDFYQFERTCQRKWWNTHLRHEYSTL